MIDPGVPRIVTLFPAIWIGLNWEEFVKPKVVVPENIRVAPVLSLVRTRALEAGAWMSERVMDMHAATAGEICEYAVQRHGVGVVVEMVVVFEMGRGELVLDTEIFHELVR
jgi:hypothetical protein